MVNIVGLDQEIGHGELQLVGPHAAGLARRRQFVAGAEEHQDIRGLRDHALAGPQDWRGKGRLTVGVVVQQFEHPRHAAAHIFRCAHNIDIVGGGFFQRQANKLAAPLYGRPIVEFVTHGSRS